MVTTRFPCPRLLRPLAAVLIAAVVAATATGCSGDSGGLSVSSGATAAAAPSTGASLSPADFAAALKRAGTTILDVRTPAEFAQGHLPGAVNVDVEGPTFGQQIAQLDPGSAYAVYCHTGNRSKVAMQLLQAQGITQVFDLAGGIAAWEQADGEVVTD